MHILYILPTPQNTSSDRYALRETLTMVEMVKDIVELLRDMV